MRARRSPIIVPAIVYTALAAAVTPALAAPECKAYGTASYQAVRTVDVNGQLQTGTVLVSGDNERDETVVQGKPVVHIRSPNRIFSFDPVAKKGIVGPPPPPKRGEPKADATTQVERRLDGAHHTLIVKKRIGDDWVQVYRSVCRSDGVLLERDFPLPIAGKMAIAKMRHTAIEVKAIAPAMFAVPSDVTVLEPPPRVPK